MIELLPCPFCGGKATRKDINYETMSAEPEDENYGGSFIECDGCGACTALHFDRKEHLVSSWNDRKPSVDELLRAALHDIIALDHHNHGPESRATKIARAALIAKASS